MKECRFFALSLADVLVAGATSSCPPLPAGAAAAGYVAHDQGYRVQNRITKVDE